MLCFSLSHVRLGCSCLVMETPALKTELLDKSEHEVLSISSCLLCIKLASFVCLYASWLLTPLCEFTWPSASWLSCCHSQNVHSLVIPRSVNCKIFGCNFMPGPNAQSASYHSTTLECTELLKQPNFFSQMFL